MSVGRHLFVGALLVWMIVAPRSPGADLVAALSSHLVAITTGFSGTEILLFGTTRGVGDVVVVVRGPDGPQVVRRKGRVLGIWINQAEMVFENVPSFYALAASRPIPEFVPERTASREGIGLQYLEFPPRTAAPAAEVKAFRAGLIRNKQKVGLYGAEPMPIIFLGGELFRTDMYIPANAPIGTYRVEIYLVRDGEIVNAEVTPLIVSKVGFEARLFDFAHRYSFFYGILAVFIAAVAGWLANLVFRKG